MNTENTKSIFKSKTAWINALMLVASFLPPVQAWLAENPVELVAVFAAINVLVRFATSGKVSLFSEDDGRKDGTGGSGTLPVWLIAVSVGVSLAGLPLLTSCSGGSFGDYQVSGSIYYRDPGSGAKAGVSFDDGPTGFVKLPVYDEDTGEVIGVADVEFAPKSEVGIEPPAAIEVTK